MITPPVGMNLFVVHGIRPDKGGIRDAIVGALPYAAIMIAFTLAADGRARHRDLAAGQDVSRQRLPCGSCRPSSCSARIAMARSHAAGGAGRLAWRASTQSIRGSTRWSRCARGGARGGAARSAARYAAGTPLSALDGIPLAVKDSMPSADLPTTWGSPAALSTARRTTNWRVARARAGGALIVGKTNVPEFTLEGYTANPLFGATAQPVEPGADARRFERRRGGSGGRRHGAAGDCARTAAARSDGPASHTGLVGLQAVDRRHGRACAPCRRCCWTSRSSAQWRAPSPTRGCCSMRCAGRMPVTARRWLRRRRPPRGRIAAAGCECCYVERSTARRSNPQIAASCRRAAERLRRAGPPGRRGRAAAGPWIHAEGWPLIGQIGLAWLFDQHPDWRGPASTEIPRGGRGRPPRVRAPVCGSIVARAWPGCAAKAPRFSSAPTCIVMPAAAALPWPAARPIRP